jgi:IclR family KDG regulon transcriptional repressor
MAGQYMAGSSACAERRVVWHRHRWLKERRVTYFLESVDRVMQVLDCFTPETPELRLTDISERLGISKATALRIVSTLETGAYLTRDPETKRFRLGVRLFHLGMIVRHQMDLRTIAEPVLRRLVDATGETAALFVPDPLGPICLDVVQSSKAMRVFAHPGTRMPWNAGTSSKVILAYLPPEEQEAILARNGFERFTEFTVTDPQRIRNILGDIRRQGYHVGVRDLDVDALGIGAPIFDDSGQIAGAIGVAAPAVRLPEAEIAPMIDLVRGATAEVSRLLGHPGEPRQERQ